MLHRYLKTLLSLAVVLLIAGCQSAPPPAKPAAAPTTAPAAPAAPAAPVAPAASPAAAPPVAPAASPAAAAPAASPAVAAPAASPAAAGNLKQVNAAAIDNINSLTHYVGVEKGIWLKHGLDVKVKVFKTGNDMAKALASGEVDFTGNAMSNFLPAVEQDLPMIAIGVSVGDGTRKMGDQHLTITAREGSGIKTIQDLKGKKIAYNGAGTTDEYIRAVLARANMKVDDVQLFNVNPGNTANAIQAGQVDAAVLQEPYGTVILETVPGAYLVLRGGDYLAYFSFLTTRPDLIQKDPDLVQKYYDGWAEAAQYVRQHTDEAALIATHWLQGLDQKVAAKAIPFQGYDPRVTTTVLESMEDQKKTLVEQKKIKGTIDINKSMDLRFMKSTLQNFPQYFSDLKATQIPG